MQNLSQRQTDILKAVVEKYTDTAEPVGSVVLERESHLGVSPATLRNEMARLTEMGYLKQPHTSAGRVPTPLALKFYVQELMKERALSVAEEVAVKDRIWDYRFQFDKLLRHATRALAERTHMLAITATKDGDVYYSGASNILDMPEFYDIDLTKTVLAILDQHDYLTKLFNQAVGDDDIHVLMGSDLGSEYLEPCSFVFTDFKAGSTESGRLGIIGPCRLNYPVVIPTVRYFGSLITEITRSW